MYIFFCSHSDGLSDTDGSVTTLSSKSFIDEDWKQSRYNYNKRHKFKNKKYVATNNRLRKRMRRKQNESIEKRPMSIDEPVKTVYETDLDDLDDSDERYLSAVLTPSFDYILINY